MKSIYIVDALNIKENILNINSKLEDSISYLSDKAASDYKNVKLFKKIAFLNKQLNDNKNIITDIENLVDEYALIESDIDKDLLLSDYELIKSKYYKMQVYDKLNSSDDSLNAIVSIVSGAGGVEAEDWAGMLLRMYLRWAELNSYQTDIISMIHSFEATNGIKKVSFIVSGDKAYGFLKHEDGVHRLVRKSPFDKNNRRHTSFCSVKVLPEINNSIKIDIIDSELKIETMRGHGAGGQHRNKVESAVRITHTPTGISVFCQSDRSQLKNKKNAIKVLTSRLYEHERSKVDDILYDPQKIEWGSQIRSYVLHPEQRVKDKRCDITINDFNYVLDGNINDFITKLIIND